MARGCRRGRHFRLTQQPSVSQGKERTSPRILIGLSFPGVDRETRGTEITKKRWLCAYSKSPSLLSVQKIPKEASNYIFSIVSSVANLLHAGDYCKTSQLWSLEVATLVIETCELLFLLILPLTLAGLGMLALTGRKNG